MKRGGGRDIEKRKRKREREGDTKSWFGYYVRSLGVDCRWFHVADHALLPLGTTTAGKPILKGVGELRSRQQGEGVVQHANRESHLYHEARGRLMTIACAAASFEPVVHTLATPSPLPPLPLSLSFHLHR